MTKQKILAVALAILIIQQTLLSADMSFATYSNTLSRTNVSSIGSSAGYKKYASISAPLLEKLVDAIAEVESGNNPSATGDKGAAQGAWQLHSISVREVNRVYGTTYSWPSDCLNTKMARQIARLYLIICGYGKKSLEETIRRYNAGKRWECPAAKRYYERVMKELY